MNFNLKSLMVAGTCAVAMFSGSEVFAQWTTMPFGNGYIHTGPGGQTHTTMPFGNGWITRGGSWTTMPFGNGYIHTGPGGQTHTTMPFGNGWITRGGSWTTMPFGNGFIHTGPGGQTHTTMPFGNGWITRGQSTAELFEDKEFYNKVDVTLFADALQIRDVPILMGFAWDLKGAEAILGRVDKKTTSAMIFEMAAQLAVEQGDANVLKQIITLAPECKKYEEKLALKGKNRGMGRTVTAFPKLTVLPQQDWEKALKGLQPWEQPALGQYYLCMAFRGMPKKTADTASLLVNEGRFTMNPQMIAMGAMELSKYPYNSKLGIKLEPAQIFAEAVELAIAKQDKDALNQIAALYGTANFKTADYAKYLQGELAMLGDNRGLKNNGAKCQPGDFSPMNFDKLIRTVYYEAPAIPMN